MLPDIEREHKRKEKLLKKQQREALLLDNFISIDGLGPGRSLRDRKPVTYTFDDYDRSINEAIKITKRKQSSPEPEPDPSPSDQRNEAHRLLWDALDYIVSLEADAFFPGFNNDGSGWPDFSSLVMGQWLYENAFARTYRPDSNDKDKDVPIESTGEKHEKKKDDENGWEEYESNPTEQLDFGHREGNANFTLPFDVCL